MGIARAIIMLLALGFAAVGIAFWAAPERTGLLFQLGVAGVDGRIALRADLGGLFVGLALLSWMGAWCRRSSYLYAAALMLVALVIGRVVGLVASGAAGFSPMQLASLAVEAGATAVLISYGRKLRSF